MNTAKLCRDLAAKAEDQKSQRQLDAKDLYERQRKEDEYNANENLKRNITGAINKAKEFAEKGRTDALIYECYPIIKEASNETLWPVTAQFNISESDLKIWNVLIKEHGFCSKKSKPIFTANMKIGFYMYW